MFASRRLSAIVVAALAVTACGPVEVRVPSGPSPMLTTEAPATPAPTSPAGPLPTPDEQLLLAQSTAVRFASSDGVRLSGRVFGSGFTGVVLSHMIRSDQRPWWWMASILADHGFTVLTYDERGTCPGAPAGCSAGALDPGATDRDILGAIRFLRSRGVTTVVVGGASLGAIASLWVASKHPRDVDAVFSLSAVRYLPPFDLTAGVIRAIPVPKLFVAGSLDSSAGPYVAAWRRASTPPVQAVVLPTASHGTDLFHDLEYSARVRSLILAFVRRVSGA